MEPTPAPIPEPIPESASLERRRGRTVVRAMRAIKAQQAATRTPMESFADGLTRVASSTPFLAAHMLWFFGWVGWNTGLFGTRAFDPYPFGLLTMVVSLEAIFLSIFVLMQGNRESAIAELRDELNLQINLRIEQEVTKTLQLVAGLYAREGHRIGEDAELQQMMQPLDAQQIERELLEQIRSSAGRAKR